MVRTTLRKLATILPNETSGLNLQEIVSRIEVAREDELLAILEQINGKSRDLGFSPAAKESIKACIDSLSVVSENRSIHTTAVEFTERMASGQIGSSEALTFIVERNIRIQTAIMALVEKTSISDLAPENRSQMAVIMAAISEDTRLDSGIKQRARAMWEKLDPEHFGTSQALRTQTAETVATKVAELMREPSKRKEEIDILLDKGNPRKTSEKKEGVLIASAVASAGKDEKRKEDKKAEKPVAEPKKDKPQEVAYGGLSAHEKMLRDHQNKQDHNPLA